MFEPFDLAVVVAAALCIEVWGWFAYRWWRRGTLVAWEPRRGVPWTLADLAAVALIFVFVGSLALAIGVWTGIVHEVPSGSVDQTPGPREMVYKLAAQSVAGVMTIALGLAILRWRGARWRDLGVAPAHVAADVRAGAVAFVAVAPPIYGLQALLSQWLPTRHPLVDAIVADPTPAIYLFAGFSAVIVAPVVEEFLFRVLLQGYLETQSHKIPGFIARARGSKALPLGEREAASDAPESEWIARPPRQVLWALLVPATIFALLHQGSAQQPRPDPVPLFLLALVLGYLYQRTHRIVPSLTVHFLLNACSLALLWLFPD